jgi:hypothetical protein
MRLEEASDKLVQIGSNMEELIKRIDKFADWWISQATMLTYLRQQIEHVHANGILKTRIQAIQSEWNEAANKFQSYMMMVCIAVPIITRLFNNRRFSGGRLANCKIAYQRPKGPLRSNSFIQPPRRRVYENCGVR